MILFEYLNLIINQFKLNIKNLFRKKSFWFTGLGFLFFALSISVIFIPLWASSGLQIGIAVAIFSGVIYADIHFTWRKSTLYRNAKLNGSDKTQIHLSTYLTMIVLGFLVAFIFLFFIWLYDLIGIVLVDWVWTSSNGQYYDFSNMDFIAYIWSVFWFITIMFSISFVFQKFIYQMRSYYSFLLVIIILLIIFGGVLNDYFGSYKYSEDYSSPYVNFKTNLYPESFFWVSLLFPFYGAGQIGSIAFDSAVMNSDGTHRFIMNFNAPFTWIGWQSFDLYPDSYKFDLLLLQPIIWTILLGFLGFIIPNKK